MQALGPGALLQEDLNAACRRSGDTLRPRQGVSVQAHQPSRHQRSREVGDHAGGVEADVVKATLYRGADAYRTLHPGDIRRQHVGAARALRLADAEGRWQTSDRWMDDGVEMRVVEVEPVQQHPVD